MHLTNILRLKRTLTSSTSTMTNDMCLPKTKILHATLPPFHFYPDSVLLLTEKFESEKKEIYFKNHRSLFLEIDDNILPKILGVLTQGTNLIEKGLDKEFIT